MKKRLGMLLAVAVLAGSIPVSVLAEDVNDQAVAVEALETAEEADDDILTAEMQQQIKEDYLAQFNGSYPSEFTIEDVWLEAYYGTYHGNQVVYIYPVGFSYPQVSGAYEIAGITFRFGVSAHRSDLLLYKDHSFVTLPKAYEQALLDADDIARIAIRRNSGDTETRFADVHLDDWYCRSAAFVSRERIMTGTGSGRFEGEAYLQRQDIALVLARYYRNHVDSALEIEDPNKQYYENAVAWAKEKHVMNGYSNGNFGVGDYITREDFAVTLYNYAQKIDQSLLKGRDKPQTGDDIFRSGRYHFQDGNLVSSYSREAMFWAVEEGIIQGEGTDVKYLDPQGTLTRGMAATMLQRYISRVRGIRFWI